MKHFGNISAVTTGTNRNLHNPLCNIACLQNISMAIRRKSDLILKGLRLVVYSEYMSWKPKEIRPHLEGIATPDSGL